MSIPDIKIPSILLDFFKSVSTTRCSYPRAAKSFIYAACDLRFSPPPIFLTYQNNRAVPRFRTPIAVRHSSLNPCVRSSSTDLTLKVFQFLPPQAFFQTTTDKRLFGISVTICVTWLRPWVWAGFLYPATGDFDCPFPSSVFRIKNRAQLYNSSRLDFTVTI